MKRQISKKHLHIIESIKSNLHDQIILQKIEKTALGKWRKTIKVQKHVSAIAENCN